MFDNISRPKDLIYVTLFIILILLYFTNFNNDYKFNLVTEVIGVFITVVIVDSLNNLHSKQQLKLQETSKLKSVHIILAPLMSKYLYDVRDISTDLGDTSEKDLTQIEFTDLTNLYNGSLRKFASYDVKVYTLYFRNLITLVEDSKSSILHLNFEYHGELIDILEEFITVNDGIEFLFDEFKTIEKFKIGNSTLVESNKAFLLKIKTGQENQTPEFIEKNSHALSAYARLFRITKENIKLIQRYEVYVNEKSINL